ncbi:helix-loop-helix DNA-binding domain-containing protein [Diplocarpon rosae]|nr:helix-loop-helix DNA-binding domain-containing protein [Diplocarpon rosae]
MAGTDVRQGSSVDDFPTPRPHNKVPTTYGWDSTAYNDSAVASDLCDSTFSPPSSPPEAKFNPDVKSAEPAFSFGTLDDWMRWDRPSDAALSPTSELFPDFMSEPMSPAVSGRELPGSGSGARGATMIGDAAVLGEDLRIDEPLFPTPTALAAPRTSDISGHEGLYSTPLTWMRLGPSSQPAAAPQHHQGPLSPEEEYQLCSIAMPPTRPATVLSKATEYIAHLEKQNGSLAQENASLRSRVDAFGILAMARQPPPPPPPHLASDQQYIMDGFNTPM